MISGAIVISTGDLLQGSSRVGPHFCKKKGFPYLLVAICVGSCEGAMSYYQNSGAVGVSEGNT